MFKFFLSFFAAFLAVFYPCMGNAARLNIYSDLVISSTSGTGTDFSDDPSGIGIFSGSSNAGQAWKVDLESDIIVKNNVTNIYIDSNGKVDFKSTNGSSISLDNGYINSRGELSFTDINIESINTSRPSLHSIYAYTDSGNVKLKSTTGNNTFSTLDSKYSIVAVELGSIGVENYNIDIENSDVGIVTEEGSKIDLKSDFNNTITIKDSKRIGINAWGSTGSNVNEINIEGYHVDVDGGQYGVHFSSGKFKVKGDSNKFSIKNMTKDGFYASGAKTKVDIENMNISVSDNAENGFLFRNTSTSNIIGNGSNLMSVKNNGSHGVSVNYANLNIENMNIISSNNNLYGFLIENGSKVDIKGSSNKNSLLLEDNASGIAINLKDKLGNIYSELNIKNMDIFVDGNDFALIEDYAIFNLENSDISMQTATDKVFTTNNNATISLKNANILGSDVFLDATGVGDSNFEMDNLKFEGQATTENTVTSVFDMKNGSEWAMKDSSNISTLNLNGSSVDLRSGIDGTYNTLTLNNFDGMDGKFYLNTYLDGDGVDTDKIVIKDSATGKGTLYITSTGNDMVWSTGNGIMVVDVTGATTDTAVFDLYGNVVDSGAYEYTLHKATDANWYLKSNGRATATAKGIANTPAIHLNIVKTGMNELRKRLGELRENNSKNKNGLWVRNYAKNLRVDDNADSKMNLYGVEAGYDHLLYATYKNTFFVGGMVGYIYTDSIKTENPVAKDGKGNANSMSVGLYASWLNNNGYYADFVYRNFWNEMKFNSTTAQNQGVMFKPDRSFSVVSVEFGKRWEYKDSDKSKFTIQPGLELSYAYAKGSKFNNNIDKKSSFSKTASKGTRLFLNSGYEQKFDKNLILMPFAEIGLKHEFDGVTRITYDGADFKSDLGGTSVEYAVGLNAKLNKDTNLYSDVTYEKGKYVESLSGNIGLRFTF